VDIWKENILEDLKEELLEYKLVGEFLAVIKKEFRVGRQRISESSRIEKTKAKRKNNGGICTEVLNGS